MSGRRLRREAVHGRILRGAVAWLVDRIDALAPGRAVQLAPSQARPCEALATIRVTYPPACPVETALEALRKSPVGAALDRRMTKCEIAVRAERFHVPYGFTTFDARRRLLAIDLAGMSPGEAAAFIAYEGTLAVLRLESGLPPCLEMERAAQFWKFAVYHEIRHVDGRESSLLKWKYSAFKKRMANGDLPGFWDVVRAWPDVQRDRMDFHLIRIGLKTPSPLREIGRFWLTRVAPPGRWETLEEQARRFTYPGRSWAVARLSEMIRHEEERQASWMESHRQEFQAA